jgi:hypothetical protein
MTIRTGDYYISLVDEIEASTSTAEYNFEKEAMSLSQKVDKLRYSIFTANYAVVKYCINNLQKLEKICKPHSLLVVYFYHFWIQKNSENLQAKEILHEKIRDTLEMLKKVPPEMMRDIRRLQNIEVDCSSLLSAFNEHGELHMVDCPFEELLQQKSPLLTVWKKEHVTLQVTIPTAGGMQPLTETSQSAIFIKNQQQALGVFQKIDEEQLVSWQQQALELKDYLIMCGLLSPEHTIETLEPYTLKVVYYQKELMPLPYCCIYWHDGQALHQQSLEDLSIVTMEKKLAFFFSDKNFSNTYALSRTEDCIKKCLNEHFKKSVDECLVQQIPVNHFIFESAIDYRLMINKADMQLHIYYPSQTNDTPLSASMSISHEISKDQISKWIRSIQGEIKNTIQGHALEAKKKYSYCLYEKLGRPEKDPRYINRITVETGAVDNRGHTVHYWNHFEDAVYILKTASFNTQSIEKAINAIKCYQALYHVLTAQNSCIKPYTERNKFDSIDQLIICAKNVNNGCHAYFCNPTDTSHVLSVELTISSTDTAEIEFALAKKMEDIRRIKHELSHWQIDVEHFLNQGSALTTSTVPVLRSEIDLKSVLDYSKSIPINDTFNDTSNLSEVLKILIEVIENDGLYDNKPYWDMPIDEGERKLLCADSKALMSHIIYALQQETDPRQILQTTLNLALIAENCPTGWLMGLTLEYNLLNNMYSEDMHNDFPLQQIALAWGDALKLGAVHEMATEPLKEGIHGIALAGQSHPQNAHINLWYLQELHQAGYHIPLAEASLFKDLYKQTALQGNYRTHEAIKAGYEQKIHASQCIRYYEEKLANAIRKPQLLSSDDPKTMEDYKKTYKAQLIKSGKATAAVINLLRSFAEEEIQMNPEYKDLKAHLEMAITERDEEMKRVEKVSKYLVDQRVAYQFIAQWRNSQKGLLKDYLTESEENDFEAYSKEICREVTSRTSSKFQDKRNHMIDKVLEELQLYSADEEIACIELTRNGVIAVLKQLQIITDRS